MTNVECTGGHDPFGETFGDCHLKEAISEMPPDLMATYKSKCKVHARLQGMAPDGVIADVAAVKAHKFLMEWVTKYWADIKTQDAQDDVDLQELFNTQNHE